MWDQRVPVREKNQDRTMAGCYRCGEENRGKRDEQRKQREPSS
ncbi:MAG: hypothetical protein V8S98_00205 [Lachnospiraceae bacterium]